MRRIVLARVLMTFVLMGGSVLSFVLDWSSNHLLNPLWHPHARFHGALLLFLLAGVSIMATWLLWRRSKEPEVAFMVATAISVAYWTPLFISRSFCRRRRGGRGGRGRSCVSMGWWCIPI